MDTHAGNLFALPPEAGRDAEQLDLLALGDGVRVERIVSRGQTTAPGVWYDQDLDEWVALLSGRAALVFEDGEVVALGPGDWLLIPAHRRHRVTSTSVEPPCVWLALHAPLPGVAAAPGG